MDNQRSLKIYFYASFSDLITNKEECSPYFYLTRHMFAKLLSNTRYNLIERRIRLRIFISSER